MNIADDQLDRKDAEIARLTAVLKSAVVGRREFRSALREARAEIARLNAALLSARADEREACARIADECDGVDNIGARIRARSEAGK